MAKGWYILHTYTGYEGKIERTIRSLLETGDLSSEAVLDIKVPVEEVVEIKDGKKKTSTKKFLPGYIMLELDLPDIGWKAVCSVIRRIQGVTGFVGTGPSERPRPISLEEAKSLLQKSGEIKGEKTARLKQSFSVGEQVKIIEGAFATFSGTIEEVNLEKNKLRVMVQIFGRATPVEVDLLQVEKI
ncbi:transcription termination/antitermination protein NusG [Treponema brennaborense]|uniref:Transcription termination/antitermination protein NusG n=1 Tax=Treponema brennaborense (strain DSM 12168 / CIP 105900 / DD5/3) TaxID=906968 RepID=F4LLS1_TREBD|nr:transcription termination/antitermination protein NusG [Treponema brennaborense]AEE17715.1 NusG antitermination factor [Treponema brennaborense DSM 12168]